MQSELNSTSDIVSSMDQSALPLELLTTALDSIAAHVVILDERGMIIYVNNAWKSFARANGYQGHTFWVGTNYVSVCPVAPGNTNPVVDGFERLMSARNGEFRIDYPCHSKEEQRWFQMRATGFTSGNEFYMVVVHENITEIKLAEQKLNTVLKELGESHALLDEALLQCVSSLGVAIEQRDPYTDGHQKRVSYLARRIAEQMQLDDETVKGIRLGALIHDIGKICIPAEILSSPRKLSEVEIAMVRAHARAGYDILKDSHFPWPLAEMIYQHHERLDGSGYPRNLRNDEIILEARIISVADVTEAISSHRPYRPGRGVETAIVELRQGRGRLFDPAVVDACLQIIEREPDLFKAKTPDQSL
ncbi:MAG: HD domain-containing protein [Leptospiraceae bacterium]|nr:HD domain-containing protein [Leptospiraceae bacterium]